MTAALEGGEWAAARPGRTLLLGKTWYPFYRRLGGARDWSGQAQNLASTGIPQIYNIHKIKNNLGLCWQFMPQGLRMPGLKRGYFSPSVHLRALLYSGRI